MSEEQARRLVDVYDARSSAQHTAIRSAADVWLKANGLMDAGGALTSAGEAVAAQIAAEELV